MDRICAFCGKTLRQRPDEPSYNFKKRRTCNKQCGASARHTKAIAKPAARFEDTSAAVGCFRYTPGTPEFAAIAALYQ